MANKLKILVVGASGQQGGSVARELLALGHQVVALTRKVDSAAARRLSELGAEVVEGDLSRRESLVEVLQGVDGVFGVTTPYEVGVEEEVEHGLNLVDAAEEAGVRHFVFSSVGKADKNTGIPHFDSKYEVEKYLSESGLAYTIVAPVFFMENWLSPWFLPAIQEGNVALALPAERKLAQISIRDIGRFVSLIFEKRDEFLGKRIDIASDDVAGQEVAGKLSSLAGQKIGYFQIPIKSMWEQNEDWGRMFDWFDRIGYDVDVGQLERDYPEVGWTRFDSWLDGQDWSVLDKSQAKAS